MPLIGIGCIPQQFVPMLLEVGVGHGTVKRDSTAITQSTLMIDLCCNIVYVLGSVTTTFLLVRDPRSRSLDSRFAKTGAKTGTWSAGGENWAPHALVLVPAGSVDRLPARLSDVCSLPQHPVGPPCLDRKGTQETTTCCLQVQLHLCQARQHKAHGDCALGCNVGLRVPCDGRGPAAPSETRAPLLHLCPRFSWQPL